MACLRFIECRRGGTGVETAFVVVVVSVLISVVVLHYGANIKAANETALKSELSSLRSTVSLFNATNGRCPDPLEEIIDADYAMPFIEGFFNKQFLKMYGLDERGKILDPFGRPYKYETGDCTVRSVSPGFEDY